MRRLFDRMARDLVLAGYSDCTGQNVQTTLHSTDAQVLPSFRRIIESDRVGIEILSVE